ncbi:VPLPA-CTERM sorting domain-containing protein [Poseidonocella sp. HB161398]|uniref:VPLPA-CTERM sorting domain-containing protein n=1 Tax=Poseidonocella sp. HB161398 TaxID=2320855 RepID=UPI00110888E8|nr:VPLPA-CTERM sorting domain-containing protein [Poseidonocella sp. HB161398]
MTNPLATTFGSLALALAATAPQAATLLTNGTADGASFDDPDFRGLMFDITTGSNSLTLTDIIATLHTGVTADYAVYYYAGSYAETEMGALGDWTLLTAFDDLTGTGSEQSLDTTDLLLEADSTYALLILGASGGGVNASWDGSTGDVIASDDNLSIENGLSVSYPLGTYYYSRGLLGGLVYEVNSEVPLPASLPLLAAGLGGIWSLRRRKAARPN